MTFKKFVLKVICSCCYFDVNKLLFLEKYHAIYNIL